MKNMTKKDLLRWFNFENATEIKINDGCISSIFIEGHEAGDFDRTNFDKEGCIELPPDSDVLIRFENGKHLKVSASEWCHIYLL